MLFEKTWGDECLAYDRNLLIELVKMSIYCIKTSN